MLKHIRLNNKFQYLVTTLGQTWTAFKNLKIVNQTGSFIDPQEGDYKHAADIIRQWASVYSSNSKTPAEKAAQAEFMQILFALKNKCEPPASVTEHVFGAYDTHAIDYLPIHTSESAVQPDIAIHGSGNLQNHWECVFVIELQVGKLDPSHKAKVVIYNEAILRLNPTRRFVISVLTNMVDVMFIKSTRSSVKTVSNHDYSHCYFYDTLNHDDGDKCGPGLMKLVHCLESPSTVGFSPSIGFSDGNNIFHIDSYLGHGSSGTVFQTLPVGDNQQRFAVKVYSNASISTIDKEAEMLTKFHGDKLFVQLHHHDRANNALILSPCGRPLDQLTINFPPSKESLNHLIAIVNQLRERKVVHRDISPNHFYYAATDGIFQVFLIDFSSAVNENEVTEFVGTSHFAAKEIYDHYNDKTASVYTPLCRHDLESFVKCFIYSWASLVKGRMNKVLATIQTYRKANKQFDELAMMREFWEETEKNIRVSSSELYNLLIIAREGDYDEVASKLRSYYG